MIWNYEQKSTIQFELPCCKRWQKSPCQDTCSGNRGPLKALSDTKLILDDHAHLGTTWYSGVPYFFFWHFLLQSGSKFKSEDTLTLIVTSMNDIISLKSYFIFGSTAQSDLQYNALSVKQQCTKKQKFFWCKSKLYVPSTILNINFIWIDTTV